MRLRFRASHLPGVVTLLATVLYFGFLGVIVAFGGEVTLRDGTVLRGTLEQVEGNAGLFIIDDGLHRFIFSNKRVTHTDANDSLPVFKPFRIDQRLAGRNPNEQIENVVSIVTITPFNEFGHRMFSLRDARGQIDIPQGITEINPEYVKVHSLKQMWDSRIATHAIPRDQIEAILRRTIDSKNVDQRLQLARFFLATEWFVQAGNELKTIEAEFPAVAEQVREAMGILDQLKARRRLEEIKLARATGRHEFAYRFLKDFAGDGAPGDVLTEVRDLLKQYDQIIEQVHQLRRELERLSGEVKNADLRAKLEEPVREISDWAHADNIARFEPFLNGVANAELAPEDRLGLAISGWLAGSAFADANADRALRLWDGRQKILQYVQEENDARRQRLLGELRAQEILSVELAARVIENLPPLEATEGLEANKPIGIEIPGAGDRKIEYWVQLPLEYNPFHRYPVIMTLHGGAVTPEKQIGWWSSEPTFQASRQGYIVVAPMYVADARQGYHYDAASHYAVLDTLIDVRRRFSVDSDRVFLTGHSLGADAAWDIGLAHPDLFAGVIPICGSPKFYCEHYWHNAEHTAFYVVEGEKDGKSPETNRKVLERMMMKGHDVLYVEFKGRGHENFSDEILRLFDWMNRRTRKKFPLSFTARAARPFDNEFYWLSVDEFVPGVLIQPQMFEADKIRPANMDGKITQTSNTIQLTLRGPKAAQLWISPGMVDLSQPVTVRVNGKLENRKVITPDLQVLLEDFRTRADRQKLFYAKMSFPRL